MPDKHHTPSFREASNPTGPVDREIGTRVRRYREQRGLSATVLAAIVGATPGQIADYEAGRMRIPAHTLFAIAQALDITLPHLFDGLADSLRQRH